jgi:hypothetical protein
MAWIFGVILALLVGLLLGACFENCRAKETGAASDASEMELQIVTVVEASPRVRNNAPPNDLNRPNGEAGSESCDEEQPAEPERREEEHLTPEQNRSNEMGVDGYVVPGVERNGGPMGGRQPSRAFSSHSLC